MSSSISDFGLYSKQLSGRRRPLTGTGSSLACPGFELFRFCVYNIKVLYRVNAALLTSCIFVRPLFLVSIRISLVAGCQLQFQVPQMTVGQLVIATDDTSPRNVARPSAVLGDAPKQVPDCAPSGAVPSHGALPDPIFPDMVHPQGCAHSVPRLK